MLNTQLEVYKLIFMAELIVSETLFVFRLKKRKHFIWRAVGAVAVCFLFAFLFPVLMYNAAYASFMFLFFFLFTVLAMKFCFQESWHDIIFCGFAAYTVQHLSYEIYNFSCMAGGFDGRVSGIYSQEAPSINGYSVVIYGGVYGTVYWLMFLFFGDRIKATGDITLKGGSLLWLSALIILVDIVLNAVSTYHGYDNKDLVYSCVIVAYNLLCCLLALLVQFGLLSRKNLESELRTVNEMRNEEQQQYIISKESIDLINRKCHDIKHQIRRYGQTESLSEDVIKSIEESISIYDTSVKTGNKALDTILSEKKLYCKFNDINLTCMADGASLGFISDASIYSLFGNMLDNAIEAVMKLDKDKREIGLVIRVENSFVSVSCYNFYSGELKFENSMPITSKEDKEYHGFGLKSIRNIVEGYDGNVSILTEDDVYTLNILIPLHKTEQNAGENNRSSVKTVSKRKILLIAIPLICILLYVCIGLIVVSTVEVLKNPFYPFNGIR